jgi:LacI family transcriptional regulator
MTLGVLEAVAEAGLGIPADVGLVTFDDPAWARLTHPALSAMAQPTYEMGLRAAELLEARIAGTSGAPEHVVMSATLRVRESSVR